MITEKDILVCNFDVTPDSFLSPSALFRYYQQAARENTDAMGLYFEKMLERGAVFVLTRMKSVLYDDVCGYDKLTIRTSSRKIKGAVFTRDFVLYRGDKLVGEASSDWVLIDINSRRICRPSVYADYFADQNELCSFGDTKKLAFDTPLENEFTYRVLFSDIDENQHLNNTHYSDICLNALSGIDEGKRIESVHIDFLAEARQGDVLKVAFSKKDDVALFEAINETADKVSFRAEIVFTNKKLSV